MTLPNVGVGNFRSGLLQRGEPLGATDLTVMLSANNQFVSPFAVVGAPAAAFIHLQSNDTTATNRVFTLDNGQFTGEQLTLVFESASSFTAKLTNTGNVALSADWTPVQNQSLSLMWDNATSVWVELGRSNVSIGSTALTNAHIFVGNASNAATDVAVSGDLTLANTGAFTIAASAVTNAKVAAAAAIDFSKLAALPSGDILVGSAGTVPTAVALSGDATLVASGALTIAPAIYKKTSVSLTQANIIAMGVTPVQLLAAAAAGTYYVIDLVEVLHTYSTAAYTGGGDVAIQYDAGAVAIADLDVTLVTAASSFNGLSKPSLYDIDASTGTAKSGFDLANAVAKSVTITNAGGAFAAGNASNILKVSLTYRVVTALV